MNHIPVKLQSHAEHNGDIFCRKKDEGGMVIFLKSCSQKFEKEGKCLVKASFMRCFEVWHEWDCRSFYCVSTALCYEVALRPLPFTFHENEPYLQLHQKIKMAVVWGDFVQRTYGEVNVSLWWTLRNPKIFQVRHIYNHPMLMRVFCLSFKIFGWLCFSRHNKVQFDTLYVSQEIYTDLFTLSIVKHFCFSNFL